MSPLIDQFPTTIPLEGHVRILRADTGEVLFEQKNVIVNVVKSLFARLMANSSEPLFGVWGLAVGAGNWADDSQPDATATQTALNSEILRKKCSFVRFVDENLNPVADGKSDIVDFQTVLNATLDNITVPIREMGLIGGGTHGSGATADTNMAQALFWDPASRNANSVTLINYKTMPPLALPPGINFIVSWILRF